MRFSLRKFTVLSETLRILNCIQLYFQSTFYPHFSLFFPIHWLLKWNEIELYINSKSIHLFQAISNIDITQTVRRLGNKSNEQTKWRISLKIIRTTRTMRTCSLTRLLSHCSRQPTIRMNGMTYQRWWIWAVAAVPEHDVASCQIAATNGNRPPNDGAEYGSASCLYAFYLWFTFVSVSACGSIPYRKLLSMCRRWTNHYPDQKVPEFIRPHTFLFVVDYVHLNVFAYLFSFRLCGFNRMMSSVCLVSHIICTNNLFLFDMPCPWTHHTHINLL